MPPPYAVRVRTAQGWQDIALTGPPGPTGPAGPTGPGGTMETYEQPTPPATTNNGAIWIDTDANPTPIVVDNAPYLDQYSWPGSGTVDGQEAYYVADDTNSVIWRMRWNESKTAWEYVGGRPLTSFVSAEQSVTVTTSTVVASGPSVTIPQWGLYRAELEWDQRMSAAGSLYVTCSQTAVILGTGQASTFTATANFLGPLRAHWSWEEPYNGTYPLRGYSGDTVKFRAWVTAGTGYISRARISLWPIFFIA